MLSPLVLDLLKSAVAPALVVVVGFFLLGGLRDPLRARLQATLWALAFAAGLYVLVGRLEMPPHDVNDAFLWVGLLLALFVWVRPQGLGSRYVLRAIFVLAIGLLTLWPIHESLTGYVQQRNLLAFFFLALGIWSITERSSQKTQTLTLITLPLISAGSLSFLLMVKGSAALSQIVSVVCALYGGLAVLLLFAPKRVAKMAVLPFTSVLLIAFMAVGHFYLDINPWLLIALCLPYFFLWIREWLVFVPRQPFFEALILSVLAAAPVVYLMWKIYQENGPLY
jgi:hypothetical protein